MTTVENAVMKGQSFPLGATVTNDGVNFSIFSKNAKRVELLLFDKVNNRQASRTFHLDPVINHTGNYWHVLVPEVKEGQIYAYRVHGPHIPERGLRFDADKVLLDPYGKAVVMPEKYRRQDAIKPGDNTSTAMKSVVVDSGAYDWEGDIPLNTPSSRTIIYEMHVRGFTQHASSGLDAKTRGTYLGLIEKIPYLKKLGITAVELLPVFQFDPQDCPDGSSNYWGYAPISFFSPHQSYSSSKDPLAPVNEFRDMIKAMHKAGIEVILDVVYNHTAEGNENGPTLCFRGMENEAYYILNEDKSLYQNYTGCGNTLNSNEPVCRRIVLDSLRYWVKEMHVDGFRFDLASILTRDAAGNPMSNPPVLWDIDSDPVLAGTKIIAEAWDAAGLYQVGQFVGDKWKEWNGRFRDDVRRFVRGDEQTIKSLSDRLLGSPEIYGHKGREAEQSVNFVTCHDGFTLYDLVSYNEKHNETNGEGNRDGSNDNCSWNSGVEGVTDNAEIISLRKRQIKNFHVINMLALGVPMILMGDEACHTQKGNNNAYCQDNEISWFNWDLLKQQGDMHRFVTLLTSRRQLRDVRPELDRLNLHELIKKSKFSWHGIKINKPDWSETSHSLALFVDNIGDELKMYWMLNAYWEPLTFELPQQKVNWKRWIDTALDTPDDIVDWQNSPEVEGLSYQVQARSTVVLIIKSL